MKHSTDQNAAERWTVVSVACAMSRFLRFPLLLRWLALAAVSATLSACANMPLNKPSALSPAQHSQAEAP